MRSWLKRRVPVDIEDDPEREAAIRAAVEKKLPDQEIRPKRRPWPCACGNLHYWTRATAHRADGTTVRLRQCTRCGAFRSTEEVVMGEGKSPFYGSADDRREAQRKRENRGRRVCRWCGETYQIGSLGRHVRRSTEPAHANQSARRRDNNRLYQRRRRAAQLEARAVLPRSKGGRPKQNKDQSDLCDIVRNGDQFVCRYHRRYWATGICPGLQAARNSGASVQQPS